MCRSMRHERSSPARSRFARVVRQGGRRQPDPPCDLARRQAARFFLDEEAKDLQTMLPSECAEGFNGSDLTPYFDNIGIGRPVVNDLMVMMRSRNSLKKRWCSHTLHKTKENKFSAMNSRLTSVAMRAPKTAFLKVVASTP
jgi:hypothetical protein